MSFNTSLSTHLAQLIVTNERYTKRKIEIKRNNKLNISLIHNICKYAGTYAYVYRVSRCWNLFLNYHIRSLRTQNQISVVFH